MASGAQDYPGNRPELLKGKEITIKPFQRIGAYTHYNNFYIDPEMRKVYAEKKLGSEPDSLVGRTFKIQSVEPYEEDGHIEAKMTLQDTKGHTLYFKYDSRFDNLDFYPFQVTGGLDLPADFYCDYITLTPDVGEEYKTAMVDGIAFLKRKEENETIYFIEVRRFEKMLVSEPKNLILTLENNKTISKADAAIGSVESPGASGYTYIAISNLTPAEIELLKKNKITSKKIHTFEDKVVEGNKLKGMLDCLITK
jgi:hypothetical protein